MNWIRNHIIIIIIIIIIILIANISNIQLIFIISTYINEYHPKQNVNKFLALAWRSSWGRGHRCRATSSRDGRGAPTAPGRPRRRHAKFDGWFFLDVSGGFLGIWTGSGPCGFWMFRGSLLDVPWCSLIFEWFSIWFEVITTSHIQMGFHHPKGRIERDQNWGFKEFNMI